MSYATTSHPLADLPDELLKSVIDFLSFDDSLNLGQTWKRFGDIVNHKVDAVSIKKLEGMSSLSRFSEVRIVALCFPYTKDDFYSRILPHLESLSKLTKVDLDGMSTRQDMRNHRESLYFEWEAQRYHVTCPLSRTELQDVSKRLFPSGARASSLCTREKVKRSVKQVESATNIRLLYDVETDDYAEVAVGFNSSEWYQWSLSLCTCVISVCTQSEAVFASLPLSPIGGAEIQRTREKKRGVMVRTNALTRRLCAALMHAANVFCTVSSREHIQQNKSCLPTHCM
jgi:hypothetical protein